MNATNRASAPAPAPPALTAQIASASARTAKIARRRVRIWEVPIRYRGRAFADGKKIGWRDGIAALWAIARYHFVD
jgi:hypothetical protein